MLVSLVVISACRKSDNATMPDGIVYLNQAQITIVEGGDPAILDTDPLGFASTVSVGLYFENSDKPDYLDLVVMKNGDAKNAKTLQANISTYPTEVAINGQQLTDLFGEEIVSGDQFDIGANYITGNKTYAAFPEGGGEGYGSGASSQPGASPAVRFSAICGFVAAEAVGTYEVVTDGWNDFGVGGTTEVTAISDTELAIEYSIPGFNPIVLEVNPGDNSVTVALQPIGDYGAGWGANQYGVFSVQSMPGNNNFINPCNGTIQVDLRYTVAAGSFGNYVLALKKVAQ